MLPCKDIVRILSSQDSSADELSWMKRAELRMHLLMCKHCSRYASQLKMMKHGFKKLFSRITQVDQGNIKRLEDDIIEKLPKTGTRK